MKGKLSQMPFLRLIALLALGISVALYFPSSASIFYSITLAVFVLLLLWNWYDNKNQIFGNRWVFGLLTALFLLMTGYTLIHLKQPFQSKSYFGNYVNDNDSIVVSIISPPQEKEKTIKATGEITTVIVHGVSQHTSGKALFYFEKDSLAHDLRYGDVLSIHATLENVKPPSNPDEFDYSNYLAMHGIYQEAYVRNNEWHFTGNNDASWLLKLTNKCRESLIALLNERIKGKEAAVASAILLGYRDDLSRSVIQQFADSGTVHVICVAGLHVGILFWLMGLLLLPLEKFKHGKLISTALLVVLLWLYALLTGLATPAIRATIMFSFLVIGRHFGKYTNSVNTLAASAFFMLLLNPFSLVDTGFQLSYLAVLGILVIYPLLNQLLNPKNFALEKIWELTCLSIAAQVAVVPLSILYFHQFPNYFVLTNLLIVPLLSIVIYAGILFFITSHIPLVSTITAWILQKSLLLMDAIVDKAPHLPYFVTKGLSISGPETLLLYAVLIALFAFFINKKYPTLILSLSCFVIFLGIRIYKDHIHFHQQIFAVYNTPKHSAIAFLSGKQCVTTQPIDSTDFSYHIQYHWWERGIKDSSSLHLEDNAFIQFNDLKIAFIANNDQLPIQKTKVNYLVVSGNEKLDMAALQNAFIFDKLIFDSSVSAYKLKKWKAECERLHISYYDVSEQGAFLETI